jgi:SAM domain (Sterile alpha motif)
VDIVVWLRSLGLEEYEAAFRDNKINERVLPSLTAEDLKELARSTFAAGTLAIDLLTKLAAYTQRG